MSDLVPSLPENKFKNEQAVKWVNANAVLQKLLQQLDADERKVIVLRCDELPHLHGTEDDFKTIFSGLLHMILQKKEEVPQLFLHISCATEEQVLSTAPGPKWFSIQFNTNILPCFDWLQANEQQMVEVAAILQKNNGSLVVAQVKSRGCIFSLSLPGKSL
jgi:hypothetical protein